MKGLLLVLVLIIVPPGWGFQQPAPVQSAIFVTNTNDAGPGSLRAAIIEVNRSRRPRTVRFAADAFSTPATIRLQSPLPVLSADIEIDGFIEGRLWQPSGVAVSGQGRSQVFAVASGASVRIRYLTITEGHADEGGGVLNGGDLVLDSVTISDNYAGSIGGGVANLGGILTIVNSTIFDNRSDGPGGGAMNDSAGSLTIINSTFSHNSGAKAGALVSRGLLNIVNSIFADSEAEFDCSASGPVIERSTSNVIESNDGCPGELSNEDPRLRAPGYYNGPTQTIPPGGRSVAINRGNNAMAVDADGHSLTWDQRGNGDPRIVGGIVDIGAVERQRASLLVVDTTTDEDRRICAPRGPEDCSLRGAIALANATAKSDLIHFDPDVFADGRRILINGTFPHIAHPVTLDAGKGGKIVVCTKQPVAGYIDSGLLKIRGLTLTDC